MKTAVEESYVIAAKELAKVSEEYEKCKYNPAREMKCRQKLFKAKERVMEYQRILLRDKPEQGFFEYLNSLLQ